MRKLCYIIPIFLLMSACTNIYEEKTISEKCNWTPHIEDCDMDCGIYIYFNKETGRCEEFAFSSCCGHPERRFDSIEECQSECE